MAEPIGSGRDEPRTNLGFLVSYPNRPCSKCGGAIAPGQMHRHEDPDWKPHYDDFEGALEGYESVETDDG